MEKVRPWCGQPSDRGRLKIISDHAVCTQQLSLALCDKSHWPRLCLPRQPLRYAASGMGFAPLLGYRVASFALFAFSRFDALSASGGWTDRHRCVYWNEQHRTFECFWHSAQMHNTLRSQQLTEQVQNVISWAQKRIERYKCFAKVWHPIWKEHVPYVNMTNKYMSYMFSYMSNLYAYMWTVRYTCGHVCRLMSRENTYMAHACIMYGHDW